MECSPSYALDYFECDNVYLKRSVVYDCVLCIFIVMFICILRFKHVPSLNDVSIGFNNNAICRSCIFIRGSYCRSFQKSPIDFALYTILAKYRHIFFIIIVIIFIYRCCCCCWKKQKTENMTSAEIDLCRGNTNTNKIKTWSDNIPPFSCHEQITLSKINEIRQWAIQNQMILTISMHISNLVRTHWDLLKLLS